jgi:multidrug efflux pump subunit AcrA (membrane-fusion protein)
MGVERKTPAGKTAYWEPRLAARRATVEHVSTTLAAVEARITELEVQHRERVAEGKKVGHLDRSLEAARSRLCNLQTRVAQAEAARGEAEAELAALREGHPGSIVLNPS